MIHLPENNQLQSCLYYQAHITRSMCWYLTAILRSYEHVAFDRTLDVATSTFEFFVPPAMNAEFTYVMNRLAERGIVHNLQQLPNRLSAGERF
jgi:hypothetical protein